MVDDALRVLLAQEEALSSAAVAQFVHRQQAAPPALLGDMKPVVSVKELMENMIDPIADNIFDAVRWDVTSKGIVDFRQRFPACQVQHESLWPSTTLPK